MKKLTKLARKLYPMMATVLMVVVAFGGIKPASLWGLHQPKMPKCLK